MVEVSFQIAPRKCAIAAFLFFVPVVVSFAIAPLVWWSDYSGIFFHLAMFLLVPCLNAPDWAKAAGYGWLILDVTTGVLTLNGLGHEIADPFRLGGHIFAGIWIVSASWFGSTPLKTIGTLTGGWLFGYTLVARVLPPLLLAPASVLMLAWLLIIAWQNGSLSRA